MATKLNKPVTREIATLRGAPLIVTLAPEGIVFREKKHKTRFLLPYGPAFLYAVRLKVDADKRAKAQARAAQRGGHILGRGK